MAIAAPNNKQCAFSRYNFSPNNFEIKYQYTIKISIGLIDQAIELPYMSRILSLLLQSMLHPLTAGLLKQVLFAMKFTVLNCK